MKNIDWYTKLKFQIVDLALLFNDLKKEIYVMVYTNLWILEDINLFESFSHLEEMVNISNDDLGKLVERIKLLDNNSSIIFDKSDLLDEFEFIKENIHLELGYITNMINYMVIVTNQNINSIEQIEKLEQCQEIDISCYNQMKINNNDLKKLRKERKDLS